MFLRQTEPNHQRLRYFWSQNDCWASRGRDGAINGPNDATEMGKKTHTHTQKQRVCRAPPSSSSCKHTSTGRPDQQPEHEPSGNRSWNASTRTHARARTRAHTHTNSPLSCSLQQRKIKNKQTSTSEFHGNFMTFYYFLEMRSFLTDIRIFIVFFKPYFIKVD